MIPHDKALRFESISRSSSCCIVIYKIIHVVCNPPKFQQSIFHLLYGFVVSLCRYAVLDSSRLGDLILGDICKQLFLIHPFQDFFLLYEESNLVCRDRSFLELAAKFPGSTA